MPDSSAEQPHKTRLLARRTAELVAWMIERSFAAPWSWSRPRWRVPRGLVRRLDEVDTDPRRLLPTALSVAALDLFEERKGSAEDLSSRRSPDPGGRQRDGHRARRRDRELA